MSVTEYKSMKYYRSHMRRYHHIVARSTESLSQHVNRNVVPVIDQVGNHCTACDKIYGDRISYKRLLYIIHGITLPK